MRFFFIAILLYSILSCSTTRETSSFVERHEVENLMMRMDSVLNTHYVVQQDSAWRETIMRQFQSIREKSDTSHTLVVDTAGRVIKETIVINNATEKTSETDRQEREVLMHRLEKMDSTVSIMQEQLSRAETLLQQEQQVVVKEKELTWWQQFRMSLADFTLWAIAIYAAVWIWKNRDLWKKLIRRL